MAALVESGPKVGAQPGANQPDNRPSLGVLILGIATAAILVLGVLSSVNDWPPGVGLAGVATALGLVGIITFVSFYKDSGDIRTAIAASVILTYFAFITVTFNSHVREILEHGSGKEMIDNFNSFVKLIVTTYIGGKSVEKAVEKAKS